MIFLAWLLLAKPVVGVPVSVALPAACYFGWLRPIARWKAGFTFRTWTGVAAFAGLSAAHYWQEWPYGMKYQGYAYTFGCACISAFLIAVVAVCGWFSRPLDSRLAAVGRWVAMLWVITYGFPWLGEYW